MRLQSWIDNPRPLFWAIFIIFVVVFGASIFLLPKRYGRLIVGDGIYYYVYLRSAWLDHDLDFTNDYTLYQQFNDSDPIKKQEMLELHKTPLGLPANWFSVGPAILWAPVFALTRAFIALANAFGAHLANDGFSYLEQAPLLFASIAYGFVGLLLIYRVSVEYFSRAASFIALIAVWLATNVVYYMGISPSASHALSLFAVALFVYLWWRWRGNRKRWQWFVWGLSAGLMTLVRWQDLVFALLALIEWLSQYKPKVPSSESDVTNPQSAALVPVARRGLIGSQKSFASWCLGGLLFAFAAILAFVPQLLAWQILYGSWLTIPQGEGFLQWTDPQILNVWFSTKRGLFTWTPIILLAVIGLIPLYRRNKILSASAIGAFLLESYFTSLPNDWWGGEAFGARRFISMMPFFAFGLAALYDALAQRASRIWLTRVAALALVVFIVWNNLFILQYSLWLKGIGHISAEPTWQEITFDKFVVPFQLLSRTK